MTDDALTPDPRCERCGAEPLPWPVAKQWLSTQSRVEQYVVRASFNVQRPDGADLHLCLECLQQLISAGLKEVRGESAAPDEAEGSG